MTPGQLIGYRRVSAVAQHPDRQLDDVDNLIAEYASGRDTRRPELTGDPLVVYSACPQSPRPPPIGSGPHGACGGRRVCAEAPDIPQRRLHILRPVAAAHGRLRRV